MMSIVSLNVRSYRAYAILCAAKIGTSGSHDYFRRDDRSAEAEAVVAMSTYFKLILRDKFVHRARLSLRNAINIPNRELAWSVRDVFGTATILSIESLLFQIFATNVETLVDRLFLSNLSMINVRVCFRVRHVQFRRRWYQVEWDL